PSRHCTILPVSVQYPARGGDPTAMLANSSGGPPRRLIAMRPAGPPGVAVTRRMTAPGWSIDEPPPRGVAGAGWLGSVAGSDRRSARTGRDLNRGGSYGVTVIVSG